MRLRLTSALPPSSADASISMRYPSLLRASISSPSTTPTISRSVDQLAEALTTDIDWIRTHTEVSEQARRWAAAKAPRGLCRGHQRWRKPNTGSPRARKARLCLRRKRRASLRKADGRQHGERADRQPDSRTSCCARPCWYRFMAERNCSSKWRSPNIRRTWRMNGSWRPTRNVSEPSGRWKSLKRKNCSFLLRPRERNLVLQTLYRRAARAARPSRQQ